MSTVYKAKDSQVNQIVAIKILHSHLASDAGIVRRFEQEAKTARILIHPNILAVRGYGKTSRGVPYLVLDLAEGTTLQETIKAAGWIPVERAIDIFMQVCAALAAAHEKRIVHRDLKPSNIILTTSADGNLLVKVLDFGVAKILPATGDTVLKLTQTGEMLGSILYMSPEQCLDKELDGRSDCYSLGCVMYETLTGKPPLSARTAFETMNKHMTEMPERLNLVRPDLKWSPGLQYIIFKAMAKDPKNRYEKINQLQDDLQKLVKGDNLTTRPSAAKVVEMSDDKISPTRLQPISLGNQGRNKKILVAFLIIFLACIVNYPSFPSGSLWLLCGALVAGFFLWVVRTYSYAYDYDASLRALPVVFENNPTEALLICIESKQAGTATSAYCVAEIACAGSNRPVMKIKIKPCKPDHPLWKNMCIASQLESLAFPMPIKAYLDANQCIGAIRVRDQLAWVEMELS